MKAKSMNRKNSYTPMNFTAKREDGSIVSITDVIENNELDGTFRCTCCGEIVYPAAVDSVHMQPHFRHAGGKACHDYTQNIKGYRKDAFWRREQELSDSEVENYKERIKQLEEIFEIFQQYHESWELCTEKFIPLFEALHYEDKLFVYNHVKKCSNLKLSKSDLARMLNKYGILYLRELFPDINVEVNGPKSVRYFYNGKKYIAGEHDITKDVEARDYSIIVRLDGKRLEAVKNEIAKNLVVIKEVNLLQNIIDKYKNKGVLKYNVIARVNNCVEFTDAKYSLNIDLKDLDCNEEDKVRYINDYIKAYINNEEALKNIKNKEDEDGYLKYRSEYWDMRCYNNKITLRYERNPWSTRASGTYVEFDFKNLGSKGFDIFIQRESRKRKKVHLDTVTCKNTIYPVLDEILKERDEKFESFKSKCPFLRKKDIIDNGTDYLIKFYNSDSEIRVYIPKKYINSIKREGPQNKISGLFLFIGNISVYSRICGNIRRG